MSRLLATARPMSRPMSRDKADTLLLLLACVLVLAPQAANQPLWITGSAIALLLWRSWITFRGNRMPPRWVLLPITAASMVGVFASFGTFFGREAGVAMLALLLTFKLLEMHARRDLFVVVFLSFFMLLTNFFDSQSMFTALLTIAAVILLLAAQLSFQYTGVVPSLRRRLRSALLIFALAAPLTIVLFTLFPRIQGPLWGLPKDANAGRSGLSDSMTPGNIAKLALSGDVAFRVKFIDPLPPPDKLYWRGIVLNHFDGRSWTRRAPLHAANAPSLQNARNIVRYQITQEAASRPWLFALDLPQGAPQLTDNRVTLSADMQLIAQRPIDERIRYELSSALDYTLPADTTPEMLDDNLRLPVGYNPASWRFAAALRKEFHSDAERVRAVLNFFGDKQYKFIYTLEPPLPLGRHSVDEFLFKTRAGFCEHYAGAFVVLMRAMGIPARVVTGYQGGERNPVDGFLTVRQSDAHAWAEVWLPARGWIRIDPTAMVSPDRIQRNVTETEAGEPLLGGLITMNAGRNSLLASLRYRWDAINNGWNQWVLNYTPQRQKSLLRSLGFDNIGAHLLLLFAAAAAAVALAFGATMLASRRKADPVELVYDQLCRRLARRGMPRQRHEGPRSYGARVMQSPALPAATKTTAQQFLDLLETARYAVPNTAARAGLLPQLKTLLKRIR
jgi:transglutaminase-like putative cysteine protease